MTDLRTVERSFICRCACHVPRNKTKLNHLLSTNVLKNVSTGNVKTVWQKKLYTVLGRNDVEQKFWHIDILEKEKGDSSERSIDLIYYLYYLLRFLRGTMEEKNSTSSDILKYLRFIDLIPSKRNNFLSHRKVIHDTLKKTLLIRNNWWKNNTVCKTFLRSFQL